jgi:hypothetical protein
MTQHRGDLSFVPIAVAGSTAGAHTATGVVLATDILRYVLNLTDSSDVTSEFSISADDEITNTTTDLTGKLLLAFIERRDGRGYTGSERLPSS